MITFYLIACLSTTLITNVSGNIFNPFASFPGFSSFPSFQNPFGSAFAPRFGSGFPFGQSFGTPFASDDPFSSSSPFAFQSSTPSFSPFASAAAGSSASSPFPSPFNGAFPGSSFGFPSFPSFPSFTDFTNLANADLKGNGIKITSTSTGDSSKPGQVQQTIKVVKTENGPGEERRIVQTITTSGPAASGASGAKATSQSGRQNQRPAQRPTRPNNQPANQSANGIQQKRPSLLRPSTTPVVPPTGLKFNATQSTSEQQSTALANPAIGKPINNQLIKPGNTATSSASSSSTSTGNTLGLNKSSTSSSQSTGSQSSQVNSGSSSFNSANSDSSSVAKSGGVTIRRVNSSGRIIEGF